MTAKVIFKTSRSFTLEWEGFGIYQTEQPYEIWLNGQKYGESEKVIQTVYGLEPDTEYQVLLKAEGAEAAFAVKTEEEFVTLNVRSFGAKGDGVHDDTLAIQAAICACPEKGRVFVPEGTYRVTSLFLKSSLVLDIGKGAVLEGHAERDKFAILPGMIQSWDEQSEYNLGSWEGNPLDIFSSMITGINVSNVVITRKGYGGGLVEG